MKKRLKLLLRFCLPAAKGCEDSEKKDRQSRSLCLSMWGCHCLLGWQLWHCAPQWAQLPPQEERPCRFWRIREREMKVTMAISTIEIKIVERFAPIQLNMENHSFAFANFGKAQALSVVASL